jgi:hypothetical protein
MRSQGVAARNAPKKLATTNQREKAMAGLEDMFRSAAPGGSIAKPLMLALLALLASGALFKGGSGAATTTGSQPTSDDGAGGLLGGLGGLLDKLQATEGRTW